MSLLDEQLKELQTRKLKVEYFKFIKTKIGDVAKDSYKEVEKEVKDLLFAFIDNQVSQIESGKLQINTDSVFSEDDVTILKTFIEKVKNVPVKEKPPILGEIPFVAETPKPKVDTSKPDKIAFALKHRALGGKTVQVLSRNSERGIVVGIDAPYIVVQLTSGVTIQSELSDINLV